MAEKRKILYLITKGNFGGAQRYVYDLATNLPKDRFEAVVACGHGNLLIEKLKDSNIKTIEIEGLGRDIKAKKDLGVLKDLIKIIKEEKPAAVHLNSSKMGFLGSLAILYLRILNLFRISNLGFRVCAVFTAHGWAFNERHRSLPFRIGACLSQYFTVLICDRTIAVSERTKKQARKFLWLRHRIKVIHNGISDFYRFSRGEAEVILAGNDSDKTVIFSIAELHKNKGVDVALRAVSLLPKEAREKTIYCIAGSGEEKENLEKLSKGLGLGKMVKLLGFVPDAKKLLAGADIFLLPSRTEALPYVLLEAGLAGVPIISTCVGGAPEIVNDMQNGILVPPRNPKEIAEAILYMLDHPDKQKEFGSEVKKTVTNFFSLEKMLGETINIYEKLAK